MRYPKTLTVVDMVTALFAATVITSCSTNPTGPNNSQATAVLSAAKQPPELANVGGPPGYEPAWVNGHTVLINAIEVPQNPTDQAQADFYEMVYPFNPATGEELMGEWPSMPQCSPCDHQGNGITPDDFHDHILDSEPANPGHGEYNALWRVWVVMPAYTADASHNAAVNSMLESMLPVKSEDDLNTLLATQVDGMPIANKIDTHFYFICDVVGAAAGSH